MRAKEFIPEKINPEITDPAFLQQKQIGDFLYIARYYKPMSSDKDKPSRKKNQIVQYWLEVVCKYGSKTVGAAIFRVEGTGENARLESYDTTVDPAFRRQGISTTMYNYVKSLGNDILPSPVQLPDGEAMWDAWRKSGHDKFLSFDKEVIDEAPLPDDWDTAAYAPGTTFKARLAYALERAKKLGTGSSRVATTIEYQGRPTVLKIAKNQKGLAQNSVEADILSDGYARQMGILIPIIDYDTQNSEPSWIHTEIAQKASEKQLCALIHCDNLRELVDAAEVLIGKNRNRKYGVDELSEKKRFFGMSEDDIETFQNYVHHLGELSSSFDLELNDLVRPANWGIYQGRPVIIDAGFNSTILNQYYGR